MISLITFCRGFIIILFLSLLLAALLFVSSEVSGEQRVDCDVGGKSQSDGCNGRSSCWISARLHACYCCRTLYHLQNVIVDCGCLCYDFGFLCLISVSFWFSYVW